MYDHVATYLFEIKIIPPYLNKADNLECQNMKDKDIEGIVANKHQKPANPGIIFINLPGNLSHHQESHNASQR